MMLFLTALTNQAQTRDFCCQMATIEAGFDFLSNVVAHGDTLLKAYLVDEGQCTLLPLDAFDGTVSLENIKELELEWQAILSSPSITPVSPQEGTIWLTKQRIRRYELSMASHQRMIDYSTGWLQRTQVNCTRSPRPDRLIGRYEFMIDYHQVQLARDEVRFNDAVARLSRMES